MPTKVAKSFTTEVSFFPFSYFLMLGRGRIKEANYLEESPRVIYGENQNWSPTFTPAQIYGTQTLTNILWNWTADKKQLIYQNQAVWGSLIITHVTSIRLGWVVGLQRNSFSLFSVSNIIVLLSRYLALYHSFTLFRNFTSCAQGVIILWVVNCHFLPEGWDTAHPGMEQTQKFGPRERNNTKETHRRETKTWITAKKHRGGKTCRTTATPLCSTHVSQV